MKKIEITCTTCGHKWMGSATRLGECPRCVPKKTTFVMSKNGDPVHDAKVDAVAASVQRDIVAHRAARDRRVAVDVPALNEIKFDMVRSYATRENARAAVSKKFGLLKPNLRYRFFIYTREDGRFVPVFIGQEAIAAGVHFDFTVVG